MVEQSKHGGRRKGAGRKAGSGRYGEATVPVRIPKSLVPAVQTLLAEAKQADKSLSSDVSLLATDYAAPAVNRPLFAASVPAGLPADADDHVETLLDLNQHFAVDDPDVFYARVSGESMIGAGIFAGDILVVNRATTARHHDIVVAAVDNELTVKRLFWREHTLELHPENVDYPVLRFSQRSQLRILGVVTGVTRKLR